jgi:hypothetical protein
MLSHEETSLPFESRFRPIGGEIRYRPVDGEKTGDVLDAVLDLFAVARHGRYNFLCNVDLLYCEERWHAALRTYLECWRYRSKDAGYKSIDSVLVCRTDILEPKHINAFGDLG